MEFNISDLLDDLKEVNVDIHPKTGASAKRIKELTMKKIHSENKGRHRTLSAFSKILIAAAVLASLAIPVMAATGFHFSDWLEGMFTNGDSYDTDLSDGSASKNWQVSGYVVELKAEEPSAQGLTLVCEEWGNGEKTGMLTANDSFWLEQWDGSAYFPMTPAAEIPDGETSTIVPNQTVSWQIGWADDYGKLESGSYRIGKTFTYTDTSGKQQPVDFYAKFRVFTEEMAPYIEACGAAVKEVRNRDCYHITQTTTGDDLSIYTGEEYDYYTSTVWKNGNNFLRERRYVQEDGTVIAHDGELFRDGKGYKLTWKEDSVLSGVASWEEIDWLDETNRDLWFGQMEISAAHVGEVCTEGNTTILLLGYTDGNGQEDYRKQSFTVDSSGKLLTAQKLWLSDKEGTEEDARYGITLEIHDTAATDIAKVIDAQAVDKPISFNWQEEQAAHPADAEGVKTEGFVNTTAQGNVTLENVVSLAKKECTLEWQNTAVVFYDETADMWKVELGFSQDSNVCQTVYLNSQGITQLVVTK